MTHKFKSHLADKEVKLKKSAHHPKIPKFSSLNIKVVDWFDRVFYKSWLDCNENSLALDYATRIQENHMFNDEVLIGKIDNDKEILIHITEIQK